MKKAESEKGRLSRATDKSTKNNAAYAADQYVTKGLRGLNLSPDQKDKLYNKLVPIVQKTVQSERGRTVTRGEGIVNRTAATKVKTAEAKIMGSQNKKPVSSPKAKVTVKPKPAPSPTSVSQLNAYLRTANPETGRIEVVRKGTYKGKSYDVDPKTGKITLNVKDTKQLKK